MSTFHTWSTRSEPMLLLLVWQSRVCFQYASHRLRAGNLHVHHAQLNAMCAQSCLAFDFNMLSWRWNVLHTVLLHCVNAQVVHTLLDGLVVSSGGSHLSMSSPRQRQLRGDGTVVVAVPAHAGSCAATARASSPCPRTRAAAPQRRTRRRRARADGQLRRDDAVVLDLLCMHLGFRRAGAAAFNNTRDFRAEELPVFSDRLAIIAQFDANGVCDFFSSL